MTNFLPLLNPSIGPSITREAASSLVGWFISWNIALKKGDDPGVAPFMIFMETPHNMITILGWSTVVRHFSNPEPRHPWAALVLLWGAWHPPSVAQPGNPAVLPIWVRLVEKRGKKGQRWFSRPGYGLYLAFLVELFAHFKQILSFWLEALDDLEWFHSPHLGGSNACLVG